MPPNLNHELKRHFGFDRFRPGQLEAVQHIQNKNNVLVVMPTGAGKSLCYQLPALLSDKTTLVVSPLIALMKDQVESLQVLNKSATFINSSLSKPEVDKRVQGLQQGRYRLVYVAPERFRSNAFLAALAKVEIHLLVVDEAHCISHWGHDFRPDYLTLSKVIALLNQPTVAALTATATLTVQDDIVRHLGLKKCQRVVTGFNRPNLSFEVEYAYEDATKLLFISKLLNRNGASAIIYTSTRAKAEEVADYLRIVCKCKCDYYHAGLNAVERSRIQESFMTDQTRVIAATNAFGMGVDKANIRHVIHFNLPSTLEAYYQEAGRAGRDGKPARSILLYSPQDRAIQEWFIENSLPEWDELAHIFDLLKDAASNHFVRTSLGYLMRMTQFYETKIRVAIAELVNEGFLIDRGDESGMMNFKLPPRPRVDFSNIVRRIHARKKYKYRQLNQIIDYSESNRCRRRIILKHFGDTGSAEAERCCDNCESQKAVQAKPPKSGQDYTETEKAALIILHAVKHLKRDVGRSRLVEILTGSKARDIFEYGWNKSKYYGRLQHFTQNQCRDFIDQLLKNRFLKLVGSDYPVLKCTPRGEEALQNLASIALAMNAAQTPAPPDSPLRQIAGLTPTQQKTLALFREGQTAEEIAELRGLSVGTIYTHISQLIGQGLVQVSSVVPVGKIKKIREVMRHVGAGALSPIKEQLPEEFSYEEIRCVVAAESLKPPKASSKHPEQNNV